MINRQSINGALVTSVCAIAIAAIVLLASVPSLLSAVFTPSGTKTDPKDEIAKLIDQHETALEKYQARFSGRSVFYLPPPPPPPPRPRQPAPEPPPPRDDPPPPVDTGPPPPPDEYFGPPPVAVMTDEAWFRGERATDPYIRLRLGQSRDGLTLLATDPPRSVFVEYDRGEYLVEVFPWETPGLISEVPPREPVVGLIPASRQYETFDPLPAEPARSIDPVVPPSAPDPEEGGIEPSNDPDPEPEQEPEPDPDPENDPGDDESGAVPAPDEPEPENIEN